MLCTEIFKSLMVFRAKFFFNKQKTGTFWWALDKRRVLKSVRKWWSLTMIIRTLIPQSSVRRNLHKELPFYRYVTFKSLMHTNLDFDIYASRYHLRNFSYFLFHCIHIYIVKVQKQVESSKNKGKELFVVIYCNCIII